MSLPWVSRGQATRIRPSRATSPAPMRRATRPTAHRCGVYIQDSPEGLIVLRVRPDGPAAAAGVQAGRCHPSAQWSAARRRAGAGVTLG